MKDNRPIWVADSETDPFELGVIPAPFIWGVYNGSDYYEFEDTEEFVEFVTNKEIILYAHNGGKFDWHFLSPWFEPEAELLIINGRLARFNIGKCEFRDSFNLMPVSLDQYNKMDFDYNKMHRLFRADHMDEIREYLKSDCVNLWNMVSGFVKEYGLHITQASAAMHYWQYKLKNKVPRSDSAFYDAVKPFYYGGRVQCFEFGDIPGDFISVDINSAYPFAMLSKHPYSVEYKVHEGEPTCKPDKWGPMLFVVAAVSRGAFPLRGTNGNLYYPADDVERIYYVTGWEVLAALETGTVDYIKYLEYWRFDEVRDFSEYVLHFWNERMRFKEAGDAGGVFYTKIFLNSLYGKFGMDPRKHKNYVLKPRSQMGKLINELDDGETLQEFREWVIHAEQQEGTRRFYNLATAASITGYVRAMLWRAICGATRPIYCDTDSITAESFGEAVHFSGELGDWGIEYEYDRLLVCGKKLYAMHIAGEPESSPDSWKIASKGARLDHKQIERVARGERVRFDNIVPTFSTSKSKPTFVSRDIVSTAQDIRKIPRGYDPTFET